MARFFFHGSSEKTLDDKNRFQLPSELRDLIMKEQKHQELYVMLGDLPWTLNIYTEQGWTALSEALEARRTTTLIEALDARRTTELIEALDARRTDNHEARRAETRFFSGTRKVVADKLWRIVLPDDLKRQARLGKAVVVAGVRRRIQIHARDRFEHLNAPPDLAEGEVWPSWTQFGALA